MVLLRRLGTIDASDIATLQPGKPVNGDVINAFLRIVERRSVCCDQMPLVFAFDSRFFVRWDEGKNLNEKYENTKYRSRDIVRLCDYDLIMFPLHDTTTSLADHWALIVVHVRQKMIVAYDSLEREHEQRCKDVFTFLDMDVRAKNPGSGRLDESSWEFVKSVPECPRQGNEVDCGVYVCAFADLLARGKELAGRTVNPGEARREFQRILRRGKFDAENFEAREPEPLNVRFANDGTPTPWVRTVVATPEGSPSVVVLQQDGGQRVRQMQRLKSYQFSRRMLAGYREAPRLPRRRPTQRRVMSTPLTPRTQTSQRKEPEVMVVEAQDNSVKTAEMEPQPSNSLTPRPMSPILHIDVSDDEDEWLEDSNDSPTTIREESSVIENPTSGQERTAPPQPSGGRDAPVANRNAAKRARQPRAKKVRVWAEDGTFVRVSLALAARIRGKRFVR